MTAYLFVLVSAGMLATMLVFVEVGRRIGVRQRKANAGADTGVGALDGPVFALFGLLVAFTFSGAAARFDHRRELIVTEANAIGTAYLRVDLLPAEAQPPLRDLYRRYVASRIASYQELSGGDADAARAEYARSLALQGEIWRASVAAARAAGSPAVMTLVVSSLNDVIDITTTRVAAIRTHVPLPVMAMMLGLAVLAAILAGRSVAGGPRQNWLNIVVFSVVVAGSIYFILDFEFPRLGMIRVDQADRLLVELLDSMR